MHLLIAGGFAWVCVGMPVACGLGSVLRSAAGRDEARWRVLGIADAFLASTAGAADALGAARASSAAMDAFVTHRYRAAMARVELTASLGERCDAADRATDVLAALGQLAADRDDRSGRQRAALKDSRAAFARAVWDAVGTAAASARRSPVSQREPMRTPSCDTQSETGPPEQLDETPRLLAGGS